MINITDKDTLPLYGVGPYLVFPMIIITVIAIHLSYCKMIPVFELKPLYWLFLVLGVVLVFNAIFLWVSAVRMSNIQDKIENGELVTDGIYSLVRHPIYAAFLHLCAGLVFISQNIFLLILIVIFWIVLSVVMANTEEKWLKEKFGQEYEDYCRNVNRFIPFAWMF